MLLNANDTGSCRRLGRQNHGPQTAKLTDPLRFLKNVKFVS
jgi:hypothetical protein